MLVQPIQDKQSAHVVVLGNEKGGSGKSTTALHIAVALLKAGQRVATIDLDSRQKSFTHYIENRRDWAARRRARPRYAPAYARPLSRQPGGHGQAPAARARHAGL
jgi:chromosome partitioning protein